MLAGAAADCSAPGSGSGAVSALADVASAAAGPAAAANDASMVVVVVEGHLWR